MLRSLQCTSKHKEGVVTVVSLPYGRSDDDPDSLRRPRIDFLNYSIIPFKRFARNIVVPIIIRRIRVKLECGFTVKIRCALAYIKINLYSLVFFVLADGLDFCEGEWRFYLITTDYTINLICNCALYYALHHRLPQRYHLYLNR